MKKLLALLLALVMVLSLVACGGDEEEESGSRRGKKETDATTEDVGEVTEEEEEDRDYKSPYVEFEEVGEVIIDDEYVTVTLSDLDEGDWGLVCSFEVENNSDVDISVYTRGVALNGQMNSCSLYADVEEGGSVEEEMDIYDLEDVDELNRLSMYLYLYDAEEYDFNKSYLIDIFPNGKAAYKDNKPAAKGKDVLVDEKGYFAAIDGYEVDAYDDLLMPFLAINETEEVLNFGMDTIAINGFGYEDYASYIVLPDTYREGEIGLYSYEHLMALGMDDPTSLDVQVYVVDEEDESLFKEEMTLYPEGKSKAEDFVYEYESDDVVVAENDYFKLTQVKKLTDDWDDVTVLFVLENKYGDALDLYGKDMKINGKSTDDAFFCDVSTGRNTYAAFYMYDSELEELDASTVESIEMKLEVRDEDYDLVFEDTVEFDVA